MCKPGYTATSAATSVNVVCSRSGATASWSIPRETLTCVANPLSFVGCYADADDPEPNADLSTRALPQFLGTNAAMTVEMCRDLAQAAGLGLFGVQSGTSCYGGGSRYMSITSTASHIFCAWLLLWQVCVHALSLLSS